jgi:acyl carrier protein
METRQIYVKLEPVFEEVFGEQISLAPEMSADDVEGWDSLTHVQLLISIEKAFGVRFSSSEISNLPNVGALAELILKHVTKSAA